MNAFERAVNETVISGISPVEQRYIGVFEGFDERPVAYRSKTTLFTAVSGVIDDHRSFVDDKEIGERLTVRNLIHGVRCLKELREKGINVKMLSVEASASLLKNENLYDCLSQVLAAEGVSGEGINLEFTPAIMDMDRATVKKALLDVKAAGLSVTIAPIDQDFAISALMDMNVDNVIFSEKLSALSTDRNKNGVFGAIVTLLNTMGVSVIADGISNDDQIRELTAIECFGFIPSVEYKGELMLKVGAREKQEILSEEEGV